MRGEDEIPFDELPESRRRSLVLGKVHHRLAATHTDAQRELWLSEPSEQLGGRSPREAIEAGDYDDVLRDAKNLIWTDPYDGAADHIYGSIRSEYGLE